MSNTSVTNDQQHKTVVGFKVSPSELFILEQYAQILHEQQIQDPKTGVNRRLLEKPEVGLLIKKCNVFLHS